MKTILSIHRVALVALALSTASVTATFAQTTPTPSTTAPTCSGGGWHHHHESVLTAAEKTQLKTAYTAALAGNGTLQAEQASLKQQFETLKGDGSSATQAQWQALHQQKETFHKNLKAAELLIDPTLAPIFAKLKAAHQGCHHSST